MNKKVLPFILLTATLFSLYGCNLPPASALISGTVWHDLCAVPDGPIPNPLPEGCVDAGGGSLQANGIREPGEPGIAGVQVDLHYGTCATAIVASMLTDANGYYQFDGILAFGSYCVAVRALTPPNDTVLIPGGWTYPLGTTGADAFANAVVESGTILNDKDFGWDYQFLPIAEDVPPVPPPASALISGIVWHDLCAVPDGPIPNPLPTGCVDEGGGSIKANGIREVGEPGIAGVQVDLHWGGCATASVASVLTDVDGYYQFDGILAFGSYCVAVRALTPPNDSILIPGGWTFPFGTTGADAFANAMVDSGTILTDKDFGWDYQFLPVAAAAAVPLSEPKFVLDKNAFCREGPGENYPDTTAVPLGDTVDVLGVSEKTDWYYIFWKKFNVNCWVASSTGHLVGDLQAIPIFTPAPTPVPTVFRPTVVPSPTSQNK